MENLVIKIILYLVILATALPAGIYLAKICSDELKKDKIYFKILFLFFIIVSLCFLFFYRNILIILSCIYILIVLRVLIVKAEKKK